MGANERRLYSQASKVMTKPKPFTPLRFDGYLLRFHLASDWSRNSKQILWPFATFHFMTNFNVTGHNDDVECFNDFDNSFLCARVQFFPTTMDF